MSNHPKTFKAARVVELNKPLQIQDVDWVDAKAGQVVVKVLASGICHSDHVVVAGIILNTL